MAKILVVDDEPDMIWALTNVLLTENHSVISVNSGEEALEKVKQVPVDLVLLDFRLPGMDGIQILEKIKQIKPELPVIMVTGYGGIEEAVQSIKLGASHYIPKPFDNQQLIDIVNKSLHLDSLKKEGLFGKRLVEKIEQRAAPSTPVKGRTSYSPEGGGPARWIKPAAFFGLAALLGFSSFFLWNQWSVKEKSYAVVSARISGLSWGGDELWVSDWFSQSVSRYQIQNEKLVLLKSVPMPGFHFTGIAWADGVIFTCDSWKQKIFKHNTDAELSIIETYESPGTSPSGLFYDGKYLWSCDGKTQKIYQHALDPQLTVVATYDSPAVFPVGLYHDKIDFWTASAVGMKIYQNGLQERFRLKKAYVFPDSFEIAQQISAFTIQGESIWITYEGVNKVFRRNFQKLRATEP